MIESIHVHMVKNPRIIICYEGDVEVELSYKTMWKKLKRDSCIDKKDIEKAAKTEAVRLSNIINKHPSYDKKRKNQEKSKLTILSEQKRIEKTVVDRMKEANGKAGANVRIRKYIAFIMDAVKKIVKEENLKQG